MTPTNVDIVRSLCAKWERGDFSSVEWADPDIELVMADGPSPGNWRGVAAMAKAWSDYLGAWEDARVEVDKYRDIDSHRILVLCHYGGRGRTSGLELSSLVSRMAAVFRLHAGRVTRLVLYWDGDRALADVGLGPAIGSER